MKKIRIFAIFVIFTALVFLISACNINTDTDEPEERIYEVKKVSLPDGFSVTGSNLSLYHDKQNAETFAHIIISDNNETKLYSISFFDDSSEYTPLPIGTVMYVRHYSGEYTYISNEGIVYHADENQNIIFEAEIKSLFDPDTLYTNIIALNLDSKQNICLVSQNKIVILDKSGKVISSIYPDNNIIKNAACSPDGQIVIGLAESIRDAGYTEIRYIDTDTYNWGKTVSVPADIKRGKQMFFTGKGYDLYYSNDEYVYGLNEGNEPQKLLEWSAAGSINVNITAMSAASPDRFICLKSSPGGCEAVTLTLEATKYYGKEENIIIAAIDLSPYTSMDIVNFNEKFQGKIKISVRDYSQYITDNFNTDRAYDILYNDIIAGETIDIIEMWNYSDEYKTLVRKGAFCDHYSFLDTSQTLNRESLIEAAKKPFEYNGTLPLIATSLSLKTLVGKTKNLPGMEDGMTAKELIDLSDSLNDDQRLFLNMNGDGLLSLTGLAGYTDFINYETSACDFSGETFIEFLKLALKINNLPKIEKDTSLLYNDKVIFSGDSTSTEIRSFFNYMQIRNQFGFDEELTVTGYPSSESNGTVVNFSTAFAVTQASKHKDSSWLFIEHLLSDESYAYQMNKDFIFDTRIMVTESWMKKLEEDVVGGYIHFAPDGIEYGSSKNVNEYGIDLTSPYPLHIITQEDFDNFYRIVNSASTPALFDEGIVSIVQEEVLPMFAGAKTPEETAKIIQSRASIYMSERN